MKRARPSDAAASAPPDTHPLNRNGCAFTQGIQAMKIGKLVGALAPLAILLASPAFAANECVAEAKVAPDNQTVPELTTVVLNASPSKPNGGDPIAYLWTQVSGPAVTLSSATAQKPSFLAPDVGPAGATVRLNLRVTGCSPALVSNITTDITITNVVGPNTPPFATASVSPQPAQEGMQVTLSSAGSSDPEGATLTYSWLQLSGPSVTLSNATAPNPTFFAPNTAYPAGASLVFRLTVSDGALTATAQTTANIVWVDDPPLAKLSCPSAVDEGQTVTLNGNASSDSDDGIKTYAWSQVLGPPNIDVGTYTTSSISFTAPVLGLGQDGFVPFRLVVTDFAGQSSQDECIVQIRDRTKPVLSGAADRTVEATSAAGASVNFTVDAYDNVDGASLANCVPASPHQFPLGDSLVGCSRNDSAGNVGTASFTVHVVDSTGPVIASHDTVIVEATSAAGAVVNYTSPGTTDAVDAPGTATCSPATGTQFALATTPVHCNASDAHGNAAAQTSFNVVVQDGTAPSITAPGDVVAEATGPLTTVDPGTATADDAVGPVTITRSPLSNLFTVGDNDITWTATDAYQNFSVAHSNVRITDTTGPVVGHNDNQVIEATGSSGAVANFDTPTATDLVDGNVAVTCDAISGDTFPLGETLVTCSASDSHGNAGSSSFTITVEDTTAPALTLPSDQTAEATGPLGANVSWIASAVDVVDGNVTPVCTPASGTDFGIATTAVNCSATDAAGNEATGTFNVTVKDSTPPVLTLPSDQVAEATGPSGAAVSWFASASDIVDGAITPVCTPASGATFTVGSHTVNCTATDTRGNESQGSFTVTVQDTTAPVLSLPGNVIKEATGSSGAAVTWTATASDIVDGNVTPVCVPASGSTFAIGGHAVNCTATDAAGNSSSGSFSVTVQDTTAPVLTLPANIVGEATGPAGRVVSYNATAIDLVDGSVTPVCSPASGSTFAIATTTVNCTATDAHGNGSSGSFTVKVQDTTAPTIAAHADVTAIATSASGAIVTYTPPTASDLVDAVVTVTCLPASGAQFALGSTTVTCTAADSQGNTSHSTFKVVVSFSFTGFFKPIDNLPIINVVKAGQAIPVKFSLGGNMGLAIFAAGFPASGPIACTTGPVDAVEETLTAGGSSLSYDASSGQYIYVWKTEKSWAASCRQLVVKFADGTSTKVANFNFTR
jgi:hypothetical protein